jgi:hypothetical protein
MERARVINVAGKEVVSINFARGKDADIAKAIAEATPLIRTRPEGTVLTLTDATEIGISRLSNERVIAFVKANKPYVKAAAVYGVSGLATAILATIRVVTGRELAAFAEREEALRWLVSRE